MKSPNPNPNPNPKLTPNREQDCSTLNPDLSMNGVRVVGSSSEGCSAVVANLQVLTSSELLSRTKSLAAEERRVTVLLITHLEEVQSRRLYAEIGFSSMWEFCTKYLHLSEGSAQRRISAMRFVQRLPIEKKKGAKEAIASGDLSLTNAAALQSFILSQKKMGAESSIPADLLSKAIGKSQQELQAKLREISPKAVQKDRTQILTGQKDRELQFVVSDELFQKLQKIKGLIAHKIPNATYGELVNFLADEVLVRLEKKLGLTSVGVQSEMIKLNAESAKTVVFSETSGQEVNVRSGVGSSSLLASMVNSQLKATGSGHHGVAPPSVVSIPAARLNLRSINLRKEWSDLKTQEAKTHDAKNNPSLTATAAAAVKPKGIFALPAGKRVYLSVQLRRKIFERAQSRCEFTYNGRRCTSQYALEVDHEVPLALDGSNDLSNLRALCRQHNLQQSREKLGY